MFFDWGNVYWTYSEKFSTAFKVKDKVTIYELEQSAEAFLVISKSIKNNVVKIIGHCDNCIIFSNLE